MKKENTKNTMIKILLIVCLACLLILMSCSRRENPGEDTTAQPDTTPGVEVTDTTPEVQTTDTTRPETVGIPSIRPEPGEIGFVSNSGEIKLEQLSLSADRVNIHHFDDTRNVLILSELERKEDGTVLIVDGYPVPKRVAVMLYDRTTGEQGEEVLIEDGHLPELITYTEDGCILYKMKYSDEPAPHSDVVSAWQVSAEGTKITLTPATYDGMTTTDNYVLSPSGTRRAWREVNAEFEGGIMLCDASGETKMICENKLLSDKVSLSEVRGYIPVGFLDEDRLLYNINGWEWSVGWGIYDLRSGKKTEFTDGNHVVGIHDGVIYGMTGGYGGISNVYRMDLSGQLTELGKSGAHTELLASILGREQYQFTFRDGRWLIVPYDAQGHCKQGYVFNEDLTAMQCEISFDLSVTTFRSLLLGGDRVTLLHTAP